MFLFSLLITVSPAQTNPEIEVERLENGLTIIYQPQAAAPAIAIALRYPVGSVHDPADRAGLAHLCEHLMFQETKKLGPGEFHAQLEAVGAVKINAYTGWSHTEYQEVVPKDALKLALSLEAERMNTMDLGLKASRVEQEKRVVANELYERLYDAPYGFFEQQIFRRLYPGRHPLHFGPIGTLEQIDAITKEDIAAFYKKHYGPFGATLVLVGGFELETAKALVREQFSDLVAQKPPPQYALKSAKRITKSINGPAWGAGVNRMTLLWPVQPTAGSQAGLQATLQVLGAMLSYGRVSRAALANMKDESIHAIEAGLLSTPANTFFRIDAIIAPGLMAQLARDRVRGMLDTYVSYAPQIQELNGAKRRMRLNFMRSMEAIDTRARLLLSAQAEFKDARRVMEYPARWDSVTARAIQTAITQHLSGGAVVAIAHPVRSSR